MRLKVINLLLFIHLLSGCAVGIHDNYYAADAASMSDDLIITMVDDASAKIIALYPPAQSRIVFSYGVTDKYGATLSAALRKAGYGVVDSKPQESSNGVESHKETSKADNKGGHQLSYLVDRIDQSIYRTSLIIDGKPISRAYINSENPHSIGAWTLAE